MKTLFGAGLALLICSAAGAQDFDAGAVGTMCAAEWNDDFAMQKFCRDTNQASHAAYVAARQIALATPDFDPASLADCEAQWLPNWKMVDFCTRGNIDGLARRKAVVAELPEDVGKVIEARCVGDWTANHTMQAFCAEQQAQAWRDLQ